MYIDVIELLVYYLCQELLTCKVMREKKELGT